MAQMPDAEVQIEIGEIKPQKWEYLATWLSYSSDDKDMNELGQLGWELVTVIVDSESIRAYFKRPIWDDE
jgi:hypothetical protein